MIDKGAFLMWNTAWITIFVLSSLFIFGVTIGVIH